ncbi:MAG: hypothetical protein EHM41_05795 [Chloroflexi bacterium]|nr:MAG: hypothetical protein EHM41_05795 [Chloroflexota bacterium]
MQGTKARPKSDRILKNNEEKHQYDSEVIALQSMRLIAAPDAKDDLSDQELADICKSKKGFSSELIQNLIEYIKSI